MPPIESYADFPKQVTQYAAISRERHGERRWRRSASYRFAAQDAVAPIVGAEFAKAALAFPLAFLADESSFLPVAVLALEARTNLFVAPDGRWLGGYVPSAFRGHPFRLLPSATGALVFCIEEESGLAAEGEEGELFFDAKGAIAEPTQRVLDFLSAVEKDRHATSRACAALTAAGVIRPWEITLRDATAPRTLQGLHRIDEAALNALPAERFEVLRQAGALPIAYCQMLSMQHLPMLGKLAEAHAARRQYDEKLAQAAFALPGSDEPVIDWNAFSRDAEKE